MFIPELYRVTDESLAFSLVDQFPLATVLSFDAAGRPCANHLPILRETRGGRNFLIGHMDARNPMRRDWERDSRAMLVFQGPQGYISPSWYVGKVNAPTWNYTALHVQARASLTTRKDEIVEILRKTTDKLEAGRAEPWRMELPAQYVDQMTSLIVGFTLEVESWECQFKLSQNREPADVAGALSGLQRERPGEAELVRFMKRANPEVNLQ